MNRNSTTLKETFETARQNYSERNFKTAETLCYKILSIDHNHFESKALLADIFSKTGDFNKAKKLLNEAIDIQPNNVSILNNLGTACKKLGETKNAIGYYEKVIQIDPNNTNAHYNLGTTSYALKELKKAKSYLQKTTELQPDFALAFFALGNIHTDLKEYEYAVSNYQKAIDLNYNLLGAHNNLGLVFRALNDFQNAISCYEKVIKIKPDHSGAHHNLALAFKELGKFDKAIKSHEMSIKYEPENPIHYFYLSELKKNILDSDLKAKIEKIIKNNSSKKNYIAYGNYLLSKYEQKTKNYEKEFSYLIKGHQCFFDSRKAQFELGVKYCFEDVLQIEEGAKVEELETKNDNKINPIFIIGVPRCGSTLVEKIIGSGTKLIPMGEETSVLEHFINAKILEKQSLNIGNVGDVQNELTDIYKRKGLILEKCDDTFTDKSLNNFFYLKLIKEIYPNAKIINCKRDILSSIVSIFQNNLTELAWAHNLDKIFRYFNNYFKIIEKYKKINPNFIYELEFEKLVNNPEEESKKLMKFCELPWDKKCLEFYKREDLFSKTTSNIQIRKAIYKHSVTKYLPYKKFLNQYGEKYSWFN